MIKHVDITKKQQVTYCIPLWLRDLQIKLAIERVKGRLEPNYDLKDEPIAVVSYGPSLNDTWQEIADFKYIITCSGAHKFLIERGIIPTYHADVDPRPHKAQLIGTPHKDVQYLIASTCHPAVFDLLEGYNVKLWHVFDTSEDALRTLPRGEWAVMGGCSVGLRTMTLARFLGFTNQHVFGMDGNEGASGKHAAAHPNQPKDYCLTEYKGKEYKTTIAMLEAAKGTWHELDQMPDVSACFHGEGLVQAMALDYVRKPAFKDKPQMSTIAFAQPELISVEYKDLNIRLHHDNLAYGVGGDQYATVVMQMAEKVKTNSVLDYGCGKGMLAKSIPYPIWEYDPAVKGKEELPRPADIVVCFDVLEHVEPDKLLYVLDDLRRVTKQVGYFVLHMGQSNKKLADGRNAHLIQHNERWWRAKIGQFFEIGMVRQNGDLLHFVVGARKIIPKKAA